MNITVSGQPKQYPEGITVAQLIEAERIETPEYVTVAVNDVFVKTGEFATFRLQEGDVVEFLYYMGGGCGI